MQYDYKLITVLITDVNVYVETICVDFEFGVDHFIKAKGFGFGQIIELPATDKSRYFAQPCRPIIVLSFDHSFFLMNIFGKRSDLPFSCKSYRKKEKSVVSFAHEQNAICSHSQTKMDDIRTSRPLFEGSYLGSRPMKSKKNLQRMITSLICGPDIF